MKYIQQGFGQLFILVLLTLTACQTSTRATNAGTETAASQSLAPKRVDIRGSIVMRRYDQGQVMLEIEGFTTTADSRYNRAFVLVLPTSQMFGLDGQTISLSELQQGQRVAIILRGGGKGSMTGVGVARKLWIENPYEL